jgi:hypothetical protein
MPFERYLVFYNFILKCLMTMLPMKDTSSRLSRRAKPGEGETLSQTSFEFGTFEQKSAQVLQFPARSVSIQQSFRESVIKSLVRLRIISK